MPFLFFVKLKEHVLLCDGQDNVINAQNQIIS